MDERKPGDERRREILEAGLALLHREGRPGLTVGNIAERIGISEAAVYRHFDSKEEIFTGMAEKVFSQEMIDPEMEMEDACQVVERLLDEIFSSLEEQPEVTAIFFREDLFKDYPEVEEILSRNRREKKERLEEIVKRGKESGEFDPGADPEAFAAIFLGTVTAEVARWREQEFSYFISGRAEELADQLARILEG